jgi:hypothetical protein
MTFNPRIPLAGLAPIALALLHAPAFASCGAAFCSINTDLAAEALGTAGGGVLDLRYERIRQDQPRTGTRRLAVGEIRRHHDEVSTTNQNLVANYTHNFASGWGVSVTAPLVARDHFHIHNHRGAQVPETWRFRELGDMRVTGRYQFAAGAQDSGAAAAGVLFGLKLPTGQRDVANANGDVAERTLQPGSGTTDAILGAFYHRQLPASGASWFAQAQWQKPLASRDGFEPGAQLSADLGYARGLNDQLSGMVQLNAVLKRRDRGPQAEPADSGSRALFLSPGLSWQASDSTRLYAFVQQPLHQKVNGVQITPRRAFTVGVSTRF